MGSPPQHAGKRQCDLPAGRVDKEHSRGCGDKFADLALIAGAVGSPPQIRGKAGAERLRWKGGGITPVDTGKSAERRTSGGHSQDYPRTCGEKFTSGEYLPSGSGSSPHRQGKNLAAIARDFQHRITPAGAGKSPTRCPALTNYLGLPLRMREKE